MNSPVVMAPTSEVHGAEASADINDSRVRVHREIDKTDKTDTNHLSKLVPLGGRVLGIQPYKVRTDGDVTKYNNESRCI